MCMQECAELGEKAPSEYEGCFYFPSQYFLNLSNRLYDRSHFKARDIWRAWMHGFRWYYNALAYDNGLPCWLPCWRPTYPLTLIDNAFQPNILPLVFFGGKWHSRTVFGDRNYTVYHISEQLWTPVSNDFLPSRMWLPVSLHPISLLIADRRCNPPGPTVPFHFVYSWRFELSFVGSPRFNGSQWD